MIEILLKWIKHSLADETRNTLWKTEVYLHSYAITKGKEEGVSGGCGMDKNGFCSD